MYFHSFPVIGNSSNLDRIFGCNKLKTSSPTDMLFGAVSEVIFAATFVLDLSEIIPFAINVFTEHIPVLSTNLL